MILRERLSGVMAPDAHVNSSGGYRIRSIYFDDYGDRCMQESEDGTAPREKWRIRAYDLNRSHILLECKSKDGDMISKSSCLITADEYHALLNAHFTGVTDRPLLNRFIFLQQTVMMRPKVIVEYMRYPYVCDEGNVRVTFDCDIVSSQDINGFFEPGIVSRPILPCGLQLMEIKYDEFLPDYIYHSIQMKDMHRISFSKYYLCRRYPACGSASITR